MLGRKLHSGTLISKQRNAGLDWYEFLCFGSPTALFAFQRNLFHTMLPDRAKGLLPRRGRPLFRNGISERKMCVPFANFC